MFAITDRLRGHLTTDWLAIITPGLATWLGRHRDGAWPRRDLNSCTTAWRQRLKGRLAPFVIPAVEEQYGSLAGQGCCQAATQTVGGGR